MTQPDQFARDTLLSSEVRRFIRLRRVAALVIVLGAVATAVGLGWSERHAWVLALGAAIFVYNETLRVFLDRWCAGSRASRRFLISVSWGQLLLDLACLALLTTWTGGAASPFLGVVVIHMIFASTLLPPRTAYLAAAAAMTFVLIGLRATDQWPEDRVPAAILLGWVLTLLLTVYFTNFITDGLRRRDRELRRQSRHTRAILDTAAEGIVTIDDGGVIESANPAAERIFGYGPGAMIGRNVTMLMPEPDRTEHDRYIADFLRTGEAKIIGAGREVVGRQQDGTPVPLDVAVSEVTVDDRRFFTGIVRDVTQRKRSEQELEDLHEKLHRQQRAMVQQEKMAAMGQMAAGVAHEISNPLASMDSLLQLIKRDPERFNEETSGQLREQVRRISLIVREMTDFAHPGETSWETTDVNTVVSGALDMVRFDHRLRQLEVSRTLSPDVGAIPMMPSAIQQVVINLIMNALDALDRAALPRLSVTTRRDDPWCVIEIADNGPGIPPENRGRVFDPFFTTKPVGHGTGLGLSISYTIVQRHGGRLEVASEVGEGARFSIRLPMERPASRP